MKIGANLQSILDAGEVSPERLRKALGWARRRWRRSSPALSPRISELLRLATFLGVGISRLLAEDTGGVVLTSRSDSDLTKFLTICAAVLHGDFLRRYPLTAPGELHPLDSV